MKKIALLIALLSLSLGALAQDLNVRVSIISSKIQTQDTRVFKTLETQITNFFNNKKWIKEGVLPQERIEASIVITLNSWDGSTQYDANAQIQSSRPVFGTAYNTPLLNINDKDWRFSYSEMENLEYIENSADNNNLALLLAYYANMIIGLDYDTFSLEGGTPYFTAAQNIVNQAQNSTYPGWKSYESNTNRYWLVDDEANVIFKPVRSMIYTYHRRCLDNFGLNIDKARIDLLNALASLEKPYRDKPNAYIFLNFFNAKKDEITNVLEKADPAQRTKTLVILKAVDPANYTKYEQATARK